MVNQINNSLVFIEKSLYTVDFFPIASTVSGGLRVFASTTLAVASIALVFFHALEAGCKSCYNYITKKKTKNIIDLRKCIASTNSLMHCSYNILKGFIATVPILGNLTLLAIETTNAFNRYNDQIKTIKYNLELQLADKEKEIEKLEQELIKTDNIVLKYEAEKNTLLENFQVLDEYSESKEEEIEQLKGELQRAQALISTQKIDNETFQKKYDEVENTLLKTVHNLNEAHIELEETKTTIKELRQKIYQISQLANCKPDSLQENNETIEYAPSDIENYLNQLMTNFELLHTLSINLCTNTEEVSPDLCEIIKNLNDRIIIFKNAFTVIREKLSEEQLEGILGNQLFNEVINSNLLSPSHKEHNFIHQQKTLNYEESTFSVFITKHVFNYPNTHRRHSLPLALSSNTNTKEHRRNSFCSSIFNQLKSNQPIFSLNNSQEEVFHNFDLHKTFYEDNSEYTCLFNDLANDRD